MTSFVLYTPFPTLKGMRPLPSDKALTEEEFISLRSNYLCGRTNNIMALLLKEDLPAHAAEQSLAGRVFATLDFMWKLENIFQEKDLSYDMQRYREEMDERDPSGWGLPMGVLSILTHFTQRHRMQQILRWVDESTTETQIRSIASVLVGLIDEINQITTVPPGLPAQSLPDLLTEAAHATELPMYHTELMVETIAQQYTLQGLLDFIQTFRFPDVRAVDGFTIHQLNYLRRRAREMQTEVDQEGLHPLMQFLLDLFTFYANNR